MKTNFIQIRNNLKEAVRNIDLSAYPESFIDENLSKQDFTNEITLGNQFFFIIDLMNFENVYTSKSIEKVLKYGLEKYTFLFGLGIIHPDDNKIVTAAMIKIVDVIANLISNNEPVYLYTFNLTYRLKVADGSYLKFLNQNLCYRIDSNAKQLNFISLFSDITFLNTSDDVHLSITGPPTDLFVFPDEELLSMIRKIPVFSQRENEILRLMFEGKTTSQIAETLKISYFTAKTHRRNMIQKSGFHNSAEMISYWRKMKAL